MAETEGVIKFQLDFQPAEPPKQNLDELNTWRNILFGLHLIGQDPARYLGYAYGNLSIRSTAHVDQFIISGSQTGGLERLEQQHYATVQHYDVRTNHVAAHGAIRPSSEALTHAVLYQLDSELQCVMHIHDPVLWQFGLNNNLPQTGPSTEYGTQQMATEVADLYRETDLRQQGLLIMAGHEDGIVSFGDSAYQAGKRLLKLWVDAWVAQTQASQSAR